MPGSAASTAAPSGTVVAAAAVAATPALSAAPAVAELSPEAAPPADASVVLRDTLASWLDAWRRQDVAAYLSHYTADFTAPGKTRDVWESERRQRLRRPQFIRVSAADVQVQDPAGARPRVSFVQRYESENYDETSRKLLTFVKQGGRWLIEKEENTRMAR